MTTLNLFILAIDDSRMRWFTSPFEPAKSPHEGSPDDQKDQRRNSDDVPTSGMPSPCSFRR
jgi:hypothetical protein